MALYGASVVMVGDTHLSAENAAIQTDSRLAYPRLTVRNLPLPGECLTKGPEEGANERLETTRSVKKAAEIGASDG
jgi:hypothetical protein